MPVLKSFPKGAVCEEGRPPSLVKNAKSTIFIFFLKRGGDFLRPTQYGWYFHRLGDNFKEIPGSL